MGAFGFAGTRRLSALRFNDVVSFFNSEEQDKHGEGDRDNGSSKN